MDKLEELRTQRRGFKSWVTRKSTQLQQALEKHAAGTNLLDVPSLRFMLEDFDKHLEKLSKTQDEIMTSTSDAEFEAEFTQFAEYEDQIKPP